MHQNADCWSRIQMLYVTQNDKSEFNLKKEQLADPLCQAISNFLNEGELSPEDTINPPIWVKEIQLYNNTNGILTREFLPISQKRRNEKKNSNFIAVIITSSYIELIS